MMIKILGTIAWTLGLTRNELVFENRVPYSELMITHSLTSFLQRWSALSSGEEKGKDPRDGGRN